MKANIKWTGGVSFAGTADSGHTVIMDGALEAGGQNQGARPMELVLIGMGGCTAFDVVHILRKSRQDISDCVAEIEAKRAETDPKVFTNIHIHFIVTGKNLDAKKVQHAIELSATKYCSASIMFGKTAKITHDFEIVASQ
ncbi:MAG: peroxiredoxin [Candidatus Muproteobacteria bacterium RIFCSPHIGHO2_01_FULL_61_200]|uniref:Peroxiredoxin n=1 Tax=Candidatus Muproteobacteria bacterium RIFCSPLOWO2_01_FULL_60_18 TaxID=1817768 RepID=A0A1F6TZ50_9PROT|nr:MAG: peroxiredoxin [Candidatus Muproteobacteria bacterium RIFCSPLOWO2_01_FULL_60_18]OGI61009.1 MAG: peroxiredoxin [Candidatus Muproteobacteria bacterium RIFCSPHIGHO2_01_FULL_61_200]